MNPKECDTDEECGFGLECFQRDSKNKAVPGCLDWEKTASDICIPIQQPNKTTEASVLPGAFRLRMYWEEGYDWQGTLKESWWCATYKDETNGRRLEFETKELANNSKRYLKGTRGLKDNEARRLKEDEQFDDDDDDNVRDDKNNNKNNDKNKDEEYDVEEYLKELEKMRKNGAKEMYLRKCRDSADGTFVDKGQAFVFLPIGVTDGTVTSNMYNSPLTELRQIVPATTEVLIKLGNGENLCWERWKRAIFLEPCDATNPMQRWIASNGHFNADKFEITMKGFTHQCVSNDHHPRRGTRINGSVLSNLGILLRFHKMLMLTVSIPVRPKQSR